MSRPADSRIPSGATVDQSRGLTIPSATLVALFVIPSRLTFAPLGGAGSPTQIIGMGMFVLWLIRRVAGNRSTVSSVHWALLALAGSILVSYVYAAVRPITVNETSAADRGLLAIIGWSGLFLMISDGVRTRADLETFLRRMTIGGGFVALVGLLQFVVKQELTNYIVVPGLSDSVALTLDNRNGFTRPQGTAIHAIEFGAVLTMILPLALHFAMTDRHRSLLSRWWPATVIAFAIPLSISRSAVISAVVILLALVPTWSRLQRRRSYAAMVALGGVIYLLVPGLLGTLTGLFSGISGDDSTLSRTNSYALAGEMIHRSPVFGRGFGTLLVKYRILDNQYLGLAITIGLVGLGVTLVLFVTAIVSCARVRRASTDARTRSLAQALLATVASMTFSMAVFDAFTFPMATNVLFLALGAVGALVRCSMPSRTGAQLDTTAGSVAP